MQINLPSVHAEVQALFDQYEDALIHNKIDILDNSFWNNPLVIRYGMNENLYGFDEIAAFRAARPSKGLLRSISRTVITTFGNDLATANTLFERDTVPGKMGRQSQTWVRTPEGWRIVSAHVSLIDKV
ncbi:hypothetical protein PSHI8_04640 [Polynucleobacter sp. SHI8]|uniref:oxalurate catabolism protein HpxZ n=1 Tax=unclassified Polynucleobacter TaxID=2640945 RepID=UPI00248FAE11|nr:MULTISPECIES: oxalurate catabolism protein HpxZ [unclassified Polynucleobacter]BDW10382.1 hypothetical protein PSHI2_04640 [Polynucleobacter sp. SHI2]BDW12828.1 hypothetical protein PSHI8_04640 [Polynucleobacter sp. SHI8]